MNKTEGKEIGRMDGSGGKRCPSATEIRKAADVILTALASNAMTPESTAIVGKIASFIERGADENARRKKILDKGPGPGANNKLGKI